MKTLKSMSKHLLTHFPKGPPVQEPLMLPNCYIRPQILSLSILMEQ